MAPAELDVELDIDPRSAGRARAMIKEAVGAEHDPDTAMLLVSEMVTNAIRHAHRVIRLRACFHADTIRLEVSDDGGGSPLAQHAYELDTHGRGLALVAALSRRWGVHFTAHGKTVWCELPANVVHHK